MNVTYLSAEGLIETAAELFATAMRQAIAERGRFLVALAGGNTPQPVYRRLTEEPFGTNLSWDLTLIYFGDERVVPPDEPQSNFFMARESLLDHVPIPGPNIHRIEGEAGAHTAANRYDHDLRTLDVTGALPRFDLMLLGIGPDGHTASLFPGTSVLANTEDYAAAVALPADSAGAKEARERVTMTYPVLDASRQIVFIVAGSDKKDALTRVAQGDMSAPAARVSPTDGQIDWLVVR